MSTNTNIGFIGLGSMGLPMAEHLLKGSKERNDVLYVWNRTERKSKTLVEQGAILCTSVKDLAQKCSIIFCMVFDDASLESMYSQVAATSFNGIFFSCATIDPNTIKKLAISSEQITFLSGPVFGRPDAAKAKALVCTVSGDSDAKAKVTPYLEMMGRHVMDVGTEPHLSNVLKLVGNFFISSIIEMLGEAQNLGDKTGVSGETIMDLVRVLIPGRIQEGYGDRIKSDSFIIDEANPGFSVTGGLKDVSLMRKLAHENGTRLEIADITHAHLQKQVEDGKSDLDWASLVEGIRK